MVVDDTAGADGLSGPVIKKSSVFGIASLEDDGATVAGVEVESAGTVGVSSGSVC